MDGYNKSGEYLLFINNDCECKNDVLQPLIKFIQDNDTAGLLTGKVIGLDGNYSGTHKLFPCLSRSLLGNEFGRWISKAKFISPKERITKPTKVQVVTGAFMFFKRSFFENKWLRYTVFLIVRRGYFKEGLGLWKRGVHDSEPEVFMLRW